MGTPFSTRTWLQGWSCSPNSAKVHIEKLGSQKTSQSVDPMVLLGSLLSWSFIKAPNCVPRMFIGSPSRLFGSKALMRVLGFTAYRKFTEVPSSKGHVPTFDDSPKNALSDGYYSRRLQLPKNLLRNLALGPSWTLGSMSCSTRFTLVAPLERHTSQTRSAMLTSFLDPDSTRTTSCKSDSMMLAIFLLASVRATPEARCV